jgi:hypothetical protein
MKKTRSIAANSLLLISFLFLNINILKAENYKILKKDPLVKKQTTSLKSKQDGKIIVRNVIRK